MNELTSIQIETKVSESLSKSKSNTDNNILKLIARYKNASGEEKTRLKTLIDLHSVHKAELESSDVNELVSTHLLKQTNHLAKQSGKIAKLSALQQQKSKLILPLPDISKSKLLK